MKRSAALREQEYWAVTTPADRARIQQKITEAIREAKTRPDQFSTAYPESHEKARSKEGGSGKRLRDISEGWSRRGVNLGRQLSQRSEKWGSAAKEKIRPNPDAELWKGVAAGMAAGLVGTLAMTGFMGLWNKTGDLVGGDLEERSRRQQQEQRGEEEPSTEKVAADLSQTVFHKRLDAATTKAVGNAVHYGFGSAVGALYGVLSELYPSLSAGHGTVYGTTVWLGADQLALPALGYAPGINERPVNEHIYGAAAHAVYGVVTETVRDVLRSWLD
jgi:putative membrane protein